jgi:ArsR family transcriptional regulator
MTAQVIGQEIEVMELARNYTPIEKCDCDMIHEEVVSRVRDKMPQEETLYDLAELFKVFGDSTRIKILWALDESEMCVCDIANLLNMTQSAISHQLRVLKQADLVKNRKEGKVVYYSLDDEHVQQIFDQGLTHINE